MTPVLAAHLEERNSDTNVNAGIISEIEAHLLHLKEEFSRYFPDVAKSPFTFDVRVPESAQEEFIEIINDTCVRSEFSSFSETPFWSCRLSDYPAFADTVLKLFCRSQQITK
jgi:hypothetical protein